MVGQGGRVIGYGGGQGSGVAGVGLVGVKGWGHGV